MSWEGYLQVVEMTSISLSAAALIMCQKVLNILGAVARIKVPVLYNSGDIFRRVTVPH